MVVYLRATITRNETSVPLVNGVVDVPASVCNEAQASLFLDFDDKNKLQLTINHDASNYFISELGVQTPSFSAERANLTQFSTPLKQYYKCTARSEVDLKENGVKVIFSDMKFEAFRTSQSADFQGKELECVSDYHSDVVIIAIGCALALLVIVILIAYLIARRRNRQRGYQSV